VRVSPKKNKLARQKKIKSTAPNLKDLAATNRWNLRKLAVVVGVWGLLGLLFTPQTYLVNLSSPTPLNWWQAYVSTFFPFMLWAILTPPLFWVCARFPLENRRLFSRVLLHFLFSILFGMAQLLMMEYSEKLLLPWTEHYRPPIPVIALIASFLASNIMFYWGIVAVNHAFNYFQKYQDREFRLVQAQLQALKTQLNPHFLFNTLNAISELVYSSPVVADKTITELSDLLRITLENDTAREVTLKEEIEFLEKYLDIQQTLLDQRLKIRIDIAPEAYDALVPNMFLQPLAENAIRHGLTSRAAGGSFSLIAARKNDNLEILVRDDGVGFETDWEAKGGVGLTNTRARLNHLYAENHRFDLLSAKATGTEIKITIPFSEQL
jgi:sensor histidine kinase YesM